MYLHLGNETVVKVKNIVGIFDIETSTISKHTRDFLAIAEKRKEVVNVTYELPKTFIVCKENGKRKVYISQISSSTLQKRFEKFVTNI